jgi:DNA repair protein RecO (recombination protein O)
MMAAERAGPAKSRAIVIRTVAFGETSSVVTLFARELGKVRTLAKGAWRPKGHFDGGLDLLSTSEVLVLRTASGGLDLLTEACLEHRFRVGTSLAAVSGGMHVAALLDDLTADADPQPELFDAAHATLRDLSGTVMPDDIVAGVVVRAELAILRITGHGPALCECAACGAALPTAGRVAFGMLDGGTLCGRCRQGRRAVISVSPAGLATLRGFASPDRRSIDLPPAVGAEVRAIMNAYLSHLLGRPPVAARWLPHQPAPKAARPRGSRERHAP